MTLEANLWKWLSRARDQMAVHMERVENYLSAGTPDVEGCYYDGNAFHVELKVAQKVPRRPDTPVRFKTRAAQVEWAERRWRAGGAVFMLLQVGGERFLLPGTLARQVHAGMTVGELRAWSQVDPRRATPREVVIACNRRGLCATLGPRALPPPDERPSLSDLAG